MGGGMFPGDVVKLDIRGPWSQYLEKREADSPEGHHSPYGIWIKLWCTMIEFLPVR